VVSAVGLFTQPVLPELVEQQPFTGTVMHSSRRTGKSYVAVRPSAMANFLAKIDQWMQGTVWTTQCSNYFRAANGRVVTQWPRSARAFWGTTRRFKSADFTFEPVPVDQPAAHAFGRG
jgi:cyclohexanone monooxygenase